MLKLKIKKKNQDGGASVFIEVSRNLCFRYLKIILTLYSDPGILTVFADNFSLVVCMNVKNSTGQSDKAAGSIAIRKILSECGVSNSFESEDDAVKILNEYACNSGFSFVKGYVSKRKDHSISGRYLRCHRAQKPKEGQRRTTKTDCQFGIHLRHDLFTNSWRISSIIGEHNHDLLKAEQAQFVRGNRHIPEEVRIRLLQLHDSKIAVPDIERILKVNKL